MILYLDEFPKHGRLHIHGVQRAGDCAFDLGEMPQVPHPKCAAVTVHSDGRRWLYSIEREVNVELCAALLARTGAFYFREDGKLYEDEDWQGALWP